MHPTAAVMKLESFFSLKLRRSLKRVSLPKSRIKAETTWTREWILVLAASRRLVTLVHSCC